MIAVTSRARLLAGAALGLGLTTFAAQPAWATCTIAANAVTCATTTTTNTTNAGATPASDRNYPVNTSGGNFTGTVNTGAVVDGFGLAFTNTVGGANALNVVNDGTIQINAGNLASAGGSAALNVTAIGATAVNYSGAGNIINLGTAGHGLFVSSAGTGNLSANVGGNVTSAAGGNGIYLFNSGTAGNIQITTTAGRTITADFVGVLADASNPATTGTVQVTNNANIVGLVANELDFGIAA